jgi:hypothetical protein
MPTAHVNFIKDKLLSVVDKPSGAPNAFCFAGVCVNMRRRSVIHGAGANLLSHLAVSI